MIGNGENVEMCSGTGENVQDSGTGAGRRALRCDRVRSEAPPTPRECREVDTGFCGEGVETAVSEEVFLQLSESEGEGNGKGGRQSETAPEGTEEEGIV